LVVMTQLQALRYLHHVGLRGSGGSASRPRRALLLSWVPDGIPPANSRSTNARSTCSICTFWRLYCGAAPP